MLISYLARTLIAVLITLSASVLMVRSNDCVILFYKGSC